MAKLFLSALFFSFYAHSWSVDKFKKPDKAHLQKTLTEIQYSVTQEEGTERPFKNEYWDEKRQGLYVDIVSGEPLFSSLDKFDSGTGWPSFFKPLSADRITKKTDRKLFSERVEVRSRYADSHLGHVFEDGPEPTGLRYCLNSASLKFIPKDELVEKGYGEYVALFTEITAAPNKMLVVNPRRFAVFAGGCFWCMEKPFDNVKGVLETTSGFAGGSLKNPTYDQVSSGKSGHREVVRVEYDTTVVTYTELLKIYWKNVDPYDPAGQFCDKGDHYKSAVYYADESQKSDFVKLKNEYIKSGLLRATVVTELIAYSDFYAAEDYHQNYYTKNPIKYNFYRSKCGRDARLKELWGSSR